MFRDLYSFENLWRQHRICRRNKRNTLNQLCFELDAEANLLALQRELRDHTYRPERYPVPEQKSLFGWPATATTTLGTAQTGCVLYGTR
jgi:hypothetical protein